MERRAAPGRSERSEACSRHDVISFSNKENASENNGGDATVARHDRPLSGYSFAQHRNCESSGTFDPGCSLSEPQVKNRTVMRLLCHIYL